MNHIFLIFSQMKTRTPVVISRRVMEEMEYFKMTLQLDIFKRTVLL